MVDGVLYTGFARVTHCKTCGAAIRDAAEDAAFLHDVELVASAKTREGVAPRKIRRRRSTRA